MHRKVPQSAPEGFKLLLKQCWSSKPRNRPSFSQILKHLDIVANNEVLLKVDEEYLKSQLCWKEEIREKMNLSELHHYQIEEDLIQKKQEELRHATDIRELYEQKLEKANNLYLELSTVLLQLNERERELIKRERAVNIRNEKIVRPILRREFSDRNKNYKKLSKPAEIELKNSVYLNNMEDQFEERGIDTVNMPASKPVLKTTLGRSKSVNSLDSYNTHASNLFKTGHEESQPPSYPSVLANKFNTNYYSESNISGPIKDPTLANSAKEISNFIELK